MNSTDRKNLYSLIDSYVLNEKVIATPNGLLKYNPIFKMVFAWLKIKDTDIWSTIIKYYISRIEIFVESKWKFPYQESLRKYSPEYKIIFWVFRWKMRAKFWDLMLHYFLKVINVNSKTKMRSEIKTTYFNNKELFKKFFILNLDRENIKKEIFHSTWLEVKELIQEVENFVVWKMEGWKYWIFSTNTRDKFINYIKTFFPLFDHIGVKIRYI